MTELATTETTTTEIELTGVSREMAMLLNLPPADQEPPLTMGADELEELEVFQCRDELASIHVAELEKGLAVDGALEPVLVFLRRGRAFIIDGRHRIAAYRNAGRGDQVPVRAFLGTPSEAVLEGQKLNRKHTLAMSKAERMNAAWKLVRLDASGQSRHTLAGIWSNTGVSRAQVTYMRRVLKELGQDGHEHNHWFKALHDFQNRTEIEQTEEDIEMMLDARAQANADKMVRACGTKLADSPELMARTLEYYLGRRLPEVVWFLRERNPSDEYDDDFGNGMF